MLTSGQTSLDAAPQEVLARIDGYVERLQRERPGVSLSRGDAVRDLILPAHRAVILLGELRDLSDQEIADALGITREAAKMRLHRARGELRKLLGASCDLYRDERNELACEPKPPARS